jgi:para-aminobenzoate synthetase component 1
MRPAPHVEALPSSLDPWTAARTFSGRPHLLFFDSSEHLPQLGRYSFVAADPIDWIEIPSVGYGLDDVFNRLAEQWTRLPAATVPGLPPFQGGLAGLFSYGLGHAIERFGRSRHNEFCTPDLAVGIYDWVIAFDHDRRKTWAIGHDSARLREVVSALQRPGKAAATMKLGAPLSSADLAPQSPLPGHSPVTSNFDRATYLRTIRRAIDYVHAGDCFQVNIAQRLIAPFAGSPLELYGRLRECNPAPFSAYFDLGDFAVASASPERFLSVRDQLVEARPIKGTRPRGSNPNNDAGLVAELANSAKDRAENVMIVDLLRNDLGRVCEYGSVRVPEICRVETYRFVHHLVSVVTGKLRSDRTPLDLLRAAFPGGSVTGAPKVRAMEIISELEPTERGPYCGSLGYIGFDGAMDANILIRTFTIGRGWAQFPVGGGIVADSEPEREYDETLDKAAGLLKALLE